jgi:hypothetical protein
VNATLTALQRLRAEGQVIHQRSSLAAFAPAHACHQLSTSVRKLRDKATTLPSARPKVEIKTIVAKFAAADYDLDALDGHEFRALCCTEETAVQPEFVAALEKAPDRLKNARCVFGLVTAYFASWRTIPNPERLERLLRTRLDADAGKNLILRKWRGSPELFRASADDFLARVICEVPDNVEDILKQYIIAPVSKLGLAARVKTAEAACQSFHAGERAHPERVCVEFFKWMTESVLSDVVPMEVFAGAVSCLIESNAAIRWDSFQSLLKPYVLKHKRLGDPRTREGALNWRFMSKEASRRYLSWLARDSINFFFNTILPNTNENRSRRDFWLQYHDKIRDFQVAVSEDDAVKVKANQHRTDLLTYSRIDHPTTSAFMMQFEGWSGDYIVIEFSESGNAAYIYKRDDFEAKKLSLRTLRFGALNRLKFDQTHRIFHSGNWESRTRYRLSAEFGINP